MMVTSARCREACHGCNKNILKHNSFTPLLFVRIVIEFVMQNVQQSYINLILSKIPGPVGSVVLRK